MDVNKFLEQAAGWVWGYPVVALCLLGAFFLTARLGAVQIRGFFHAIALIRGKYDKPGETGHISHFQALSAAVSATVGLGNIAGVAVAIAMGGPGAVFWMWMIGLLGMATKYTECGLGTYFREKLPGTGEVRGGPMYYITKGMGPRFKWLAMFFAVSAAIASLGGGNMFQSNQAASALNTYYAVPEWLTGLVLAGLVAMVIIGGIRRIGQVAGMVVPFMCTVYVLGALIICLINADKLPNVFSIIIEDAFSGRAAAGGSMGAVIIMGVRRAVFSSEAGLGSAPMAHAAARTEIPIRQGIVASLEPFIDTVVVCSATASVIILSGLYGSEKYAPLVPPEGLRTEVRIEPGEEGVHYGGGWVLASEGIPPYRGLQDLTEGTHAARAVADGRLTLPAMAASDHGVRFSCWHGGGATRRLEILDAAGETVLASLPVTDEAVEHEAGAPSVGPCWKEGHWHGHLVGFGDVLAGTAPRDGDGGAPGFRLRFVREGDAGGDWWVDRVQVVEDRAGIALTIAAFDKAFPVFTGFGSLFIVFAVVLFAFSTAITWSYYGETAAAYCLGTRVILPFKWLFVAALFFGAIYGLEPVLNFSDLMLGLMVVPNMIAILYLSGTANRLTRDYFTRLKSGEFDRN